MMLKSVGVCEQEVAAGGRGRRRTYADGVRRTPREEVRTGEIRRRSVKICQQQGLSSAGEAEATP
jgi:hypothetical protein